MIFVDIQTVGNPNLLPYPSPPAKERRLRTKPAAILNSARTGLASTHVKAMHWKASLSLIVAVLFAGCATGKLALQHPSLPPVKERRQGTLQLRVADKRADRSKIGITKNDFGKKTGDILTEEDPAFFVEAVLTDVLKNLGYSVSPTANLTLEGEIQEFKVDTDGWNETATQKVHVSLRDRNGSVLWEANLAGEHNGMVVGENSISDSVNMALDRLARDAQRELSSDALQELVRKGG